MQAALSPVPALRPFNVASVRADFPILSRSVNGKPLVYFDNAASAQKPTFVLDRVREFAETSNANVHRGLHTLSNLATDAYEAARHQRARQPAQHGAGDGADDVQHDEGRDQQADVELDQRIGVD